jgi:hypothetical protein
MATFSTASCGLVLTALNAVSAEFANGLLVTAIGISLLAAGLAVRFRDGAAHIWT